jgi:hypothetical protein
MACGDKQQQHQQHLPLSEQQSSIPTYSVASFPSQPLKITLSIKQIEFKNHTLQQAAGEQEQRVRGGDEAAHQVVIFEVP